jgi:outer membrane protein assembly factor BamB
MMLSAQTLIGVAVAAGASMAAGGGVSTQWLMSDFDRGFYSYEQGSGAAVSLGMIPDSVVGIEFAGDGHLYGMTSVGNGNNFYRIDPTDGTSVLVGNTGLPQVIEGDLAWDATGGLMYGSYSTSDSNSLYTFDVATGLASYVGDMEEDDISGMAFDQSGRLWAVDTNVNGSGVADLLEINKANGGVLSRVSLGIVINGPLIGMDLNDATGEIFMAMDNGGFYSIDTDAGTALQVDTHGVGTATGLAYVPAPGSLFVLVGAGLVGSRRRR